MSVKRCVRPRCCKVGRARLIQRSGTSYYELRGETATDLPGFSFCPWCGIGLIPPEMS